MTKFSDIEVQVAEQGDQKTAYKWVGFLADVLFEVTVFELYVMSQMSAEQLVWRKLQRVRTNVIVSVYW